MTQEELLEAIADAEYQSEEYEELTGELTQRVREEILNQLRNPTTNCEYEEEAAIVAGFDNAAAHGIWTRREIANSVSLLRTLLRDYIRDEHRSVCRTVQLRRQLAGRAETG